MKRALPLVLAGVLLAGCASTGEPDQAEREHLRAAPPAGWIPGVATDTATLRMSEFVRPDVTESGWQEKITFERLSARPVADAREFVEVVREDLVASCPRGQLFNTYSGTENGYAVEVALMTCPKSTVTQMGQLTMLKVIQGNNALYTITRARRMPPFDEPGADRSLPREAIAEWSADLSAMSVCDPRSPEAHPCGSSVMKKRSPRGSR